jgi:imidazolonepropionase-like amidohydrolase
MCILRNTVLHCVIQQGGAIAADVGSFVTASNCSIRNCQAVIGGAMLSAGNLTLQSVLLDSCSAEQSGGAVHSTAEGYATSTGCTFSRNEVTHEQTSVRTTTAAAVTTLLHIAASCNATECFTRAYFRTHVLDRSTNRQITR